MRAVIYIRVSTREQVENFSLDTQQRACIDYCRREGIEVDSIFVEEGESAKTANRPQLQALLEHCRKNRKRVDLVVVYNVSRLARQVLDHQTIRFALAKLGVHVRAVTETFDDTASGKLVENMLAVIAQFDNDQRAARTIEGMREALSRGRWTHQPPLGYVKAADRDGPSLVPDPERASLVQVAFERMATGRFTKREVLGEVTALGLRTRRGAPLSLQTFGSMLRNPLYPGRVRVPKWDFEGPGDFEPLVSAELFRRVQAVLDGRRPSPERRSRDHPDFPLRRFVQCGACGAPFTGSWSKGRTRRYAYYRCTNPECKEANVAKRRIETVFVEGLDKLAARPEVLALFFEIVRDAWKERHAAALERQAQLETRLQLTQQRIGRLVDAFLYEGKIDKATYDEQRARLDQEMDAVQEQIDAALPEDLDLEGVLEFAERVLSNPAGCWQALAPDLRPGFQQAVYPNGLSYRAGEFGTAETSWAFEYLQQEVNENNSMASPAGVEPASPP